MTTLRFSTVNCAVVVVASSLLVLAACGQSVQQYATTDEVRAALHEVGILCADFRWDPPSMAQACSFADDVPGARTSGVVVIYADQRDIEAALSRCRDDAASGGQFLYSEGQSWLASIERYEADRTTAHNIDDQEFVSRVADVLRTEVIDC
jgi:hypothetical protein